MEENILVENQPINETPKRPQSLTALCVLSFIWCSLLLLCLFIGLLCSSFIFSTAESLLNGTNGMPPLEESQEKALQMLVDMGPKKFVMGIAIAIIMYMTSFLGVFKMWKLQKWGFYIYAGVNAIGVIYDVFSGSYVMAVISLAFIGMYFSNFKHMK